MPLYRECDPAAILRFHFRRVTSSIMSRPKSRDAVKPGSNNCSILLTSTKINRHSSIVFSFGWRYYTPPAFVSPYRSITRIMQRRFYCDLITVNSGFLLRARANRMQNFICNMQIILDIMQSIHYNMTRIIIKEY